MTKVTASNIIRHITHTLTFVTFLTIFISSMLLLSNDALSRETRMSTPVKVNKSRSVRQKNVMPAVKIPATNAATVSAILNRRSNSTVIKMPDRIAGKTVSTRNKQRRINALRKKNKLRKRKMNAQNDNNNVRPGNLSEAEIFLEYMHLIDTDGDGIISASEIRAFFDLIDRMVAAGPGNRIGYLSYDLAKRIQFNQDFLSRVYNFAAALRGRKGDATYREIALVLCRLGILSICKNGTPTTPGPSTRIGYLQKDELDRFDDKTVLVIMSAADEAFIKKDYQGKKDKDLSLAANDNVANNESRNYASNETKQNLYEFSASELADLEAAASANQLPSVEDLANLAPAAGGAINRPTPPNINSGMDYLQAGILK